jgi:ATP/ADP translocase
MFKILTTLLLITITSTLIFAFIYYQHDNNCKGFLDALYTSAMIQTLVGIQNEPASRITKFSMIFQSLISYLITAHIIIFSHVYIKSI